MYFFKDITKQNNHSQFFLRQRAPYLWGRCQRQWDCSWLGRFSAEGKTWDDKYFQEYPQLNILRNKFLVKHILRHVESMQTYIFTFQAARTIYFRDTYMTEKEETLRRGFSARKQTESYSRNSDYSCNSPVRLQLIEI